MRNILFVHPDHKLVGIYNQYLSPHFSIDSAQDGLTGLRMIKQNRPHLIVSDFNLAYMSGLSLLKYVRNHKELYDRPFIFLTNEPMRHDALGLGANAWLNQKEHGPDSIIYQIATHLKVL